MTPMLLEVFSLVIAALLILIPLTALRTLLLWCSEDISWNKWMRWFFILFSLLIFVYPFWREEIGKDPLDVPISLSRMERIDTMVHFPLKEPYSVELCFYIKDRNIRKKIRDDDDAKKSPPIGLKWEIYSSSGELLVSKTSVKSEMGAWSVDWISRRMGNTSINFREYLEPGDYRFVAQVLNNAPELAHFETRLVLELYPGIANTWQKSILSYVTFFGELVLGVYFIVLIIFITNELRRFKYGRRT